MQLSSSMPTPIAAARRAPDDDSLLVTSRLDAAEALRQPGVDIVRVRRRLAPEVSEAAARRCAFGPVFEWITRLDIPTLDADGLGALFQDLEDGPLRSALLDDIGTLASRWMALTGRRHGRATLALVDTDKCRKLHTDYLDLRILSTYSGPGTWLVPERGLDRSALGKPTLAEEANGQICPDPAHLTQADTGDIVFLKGRAWGEGARGAVHRSPALEGTGQRRLVLTIDGMECGC